MTKIEQIRHELGEKIAHYGEAYVLVDPYLREPKGQAFDDIAAKDVVDIPLRHPALAFDQRPRLCRIRASNTGLIEASIEAALWEQTRPERETEVGTTIGGWLFSKEEPFRIARDLARAMQIVRPGGQRPSYVRWGDPRVMAWLWPMLRANQKCQLMASLETWLSFNRRGDWVEYEKPADEDTSDQFGLSKIRFSAEQWRVADQGEQVHAVIRAWQQMTKTLPNDYMVQANMYVRAAIQAGAREMQDIIVLALCAIQVHPHFIDHPRIQSCIAEAARSASPLQERLQSLGTTYGWARVRDELEGAKYKGAATKSAR